MNKLIAMAAIAMMASSVSAYAGEGAGHPFEYTNAGIQSRTSSTVRVPARGQDPFPFRVMDRVVTAMPFGLVPSERSEAVVQTYNALPASPGRLRMAERNPVVMPPA